MSTVVKIWLSLMLMAAGIYGTYTLARLINQRRPPVTKTEIASKPTRQLDEFAFTDTAGKKFALKDLKGQVWVASFFFADCAGACIQMNQLLASVQKELAELGVQVVSISVDPTNDTPERLTEYSQRFADGSKNWQFLTGSFEDTHDLGDGVFKVSVLGRDHSDRLILVDRNGEVQGRFSSRDPVQFQSFMKKVREVVAEEAALPAADKHDEPETAKAAAEKSPS